jgi:hypothetical protein
MISDRPIEVGVAAHDRIAEMALDPRQHLVQRPGGRLRRARVARLVDHPQTLAAAAQRYHQRLVGPASIVAEVRPFLVLAVKRLDVAIEVDQGQLVLGALAPHAARQFGPRLLLDLVNHGRELFDLVGSLEAAQKIARRGRVRYPASSHQPAHRLAPLQRPLILQARPIGIQCVGQCQHVVGLVIRRMPLEQPQTLIQALRNSKPPHELLRQHQAAIVRHLAPRRGLQMQQPMAHHMAPGLRPGQLLGLHTGPPIDVTGALECDRYFHSGALCFGNSLLLGRTTYTSFGRAFPIFLRVTILLRAYFRARWG